MSDSISLQRANLHDFHFLVIDPELWPLIFAPNAIPHLAEVRKSSDCLFLKFKTVSAIAESGFCSNSNPSFFNPDWNPGKIKTIGIDVILEDTPHEK